MSDVGVEGKEAGERLQTSALSAFIVQHEQNESDPPESQTACSDPQRPGRGVISDLYGLTDPPVTNGRVDRQESPLGQD
ncbi:MAG: hypothetical protein OXD50_08580 [Chloroflexi bacterium]|nr:hypothetical protein [Chloroflexota bacterium]